MITREKEVLGIAYQVQRQELMMVGCVLRGNPGQLGDAGRVLKDIFIMVEIEVCHHFSVLALFLVYHGLFHSGEISDGFQGLPIDLPHQPALPAAFIQRYPFHLILPNIIEQTAQKGQEQCRDKS